MVLTSDMTYIQTCIGFIFGYFAVAFILLPVYYRLRLTTIYSYLDRRLGRQAYRTGAAFFILSKVVGSAVRFYVVCAILQRFVLDALGVPFVVTVVAMVGLIWLYTRRGGIKTLVWTDTFQTLCMFAALILIIYNVARHLGMSMGEAADIYVPNDEVGMKMYNYIRCSLDFDQLIYEYRSKTGARWMHVSYRADGNNRHEAWINASNASRRDRQR